jgi:nucleotide-binding universal stress UspA family protein
MRVNNVLVPVDFSPPSKLAVDYGVALARAFHARLTLLHVVSPMTASVDKNCARDVVTSLSALVSPEDQGDLDVAIAVKIGSVEEEIKTVVRERNVDFVVMGTHGRGLLGRMFIGSETERILRKIETPVLTVCHSTAGLNFERILFATDLSQAAEHAYRFVLDIAETHQSNVTIVHAVDVPVDIDVIAKRALDDLVTIAESRGIKAESALVHGHPAEQILDIADTNNVDMIVLGIERRPFLERTLLGKTAERVIREAYVPVLSIPLAAPLGARSNIDQEVEAG